MKAIMVGAILSALVATFLIVSGVELSWQIGLGLVVVMIIVGRIINYFMEKNARALDKDDG